MAYADFDLKTAVQRFELTTVEDIDLFGGVEPVELSDSVKNFLREFSPVALGINSEQARREFIISPILTEAKRRSKVEINVLPGITLSVDPSRGLTGNCDYLIARSTELYYLRAPIVAVVEAKREDLIAGLGQCAAEMVAIQLFNEKDGTAFPAVYGCVTSGTHWRFLKLIAKDLNIDRPEYYVRDAAKILGILVAIGRG
jgi:hypothetical protein